MYTQYLPENGAAESVRANCSAGEASSQRIAPLHASATTLLLIAAGNICGGTGVAYAPVMYFSGTDFYVHAVNGARDVAVALIVAFEDQPPTLSSSVLSFDVATRQASVDVALYASNVQGNAMSLTDIIVSAGMSATASGLLLSVDVGAISTPLYLSGSPISPFWVMSCVVTDGTAGTSCTVVFAIKCGVGMVPNTWAVGECVWGRALVRSRLPECVTCARRRRFVPVVPSRGHVLRRRA